LKGSIHDVISVDNEVGPGTNKRQGIGMRTLVAACLLYGAMVLLFALISLYAAPQASQIGTFRPYPTIPFHELILGLLGLGLGLAASAAVRKLDLGLVLLVPALVVLTDLDHLPAFLGLAQPIRPAHSVIFILCTVVLMAAVIRRTDVVLTSLSAFFAHLSIDTGVFPAFSPVSFQYYNIGEFRVPFLIAAVAFALAAGFVINHNRHKGVV
jgi:hypothetical protein